MCVGIFDSDKVDADKRSKSYGGIVHLVQRRGHRGTLVPYIRETRKEKQKLDYCALWGTIIDLSIWFPIPY